MADCLGYQTPAPHGLMGPVNEVLTAVSKESTEEASAGRRAAATGDKVA